MPDVIDRDGLRQLAAAAVPEVGGRVYHSDGGLPDELTPYIVQAVQTDVHDNDLLPPLTTVTYWVFTDALQRWVTVDHMVGELIAGLDQVKLVGDDDSQYLITYAGTAAQDVIPDERDLKGREVRFTVESVAYASDDTYTPDPSGTLGALVRLYFPQVQVNPSAWSPTDTAPGVFWRLTRSDDAGALALGGVGRWVDHRLAASVVAPTHRGTRAWCRRLVETLSALDEVTLGDAPAFIQPGTQAAYEDTRRVGQVTLTLRAGVLRPVPADDPGSPTLIEHALGRTDGGTLIPDGDPTEFMAIP